jgi:hypothetical protein
MNNVKSNDLGFALILMIVFLSVIGLLILDPIEQDPRYHLFKDTRTILNIPNFWNVVSNLPFLIVGGVGLRKVLGNHYLCLETGMKSAYVLFFSGIALVAIGSGYYHLSPSNETLVWDRLPMSIAFMALFSVVVGEFISPEAGKFLLAPTILVGISSVLYWSVTESIGEGDLRIYALVQFLPMLVIPVILICFRSSFSKAAAYWWLLTAYVAAKLFEHFDARVYGSLKLLSGHTLKHVVAAVGLYILLWSYQKRDSVLDAES